MRLTLLLACLAPAPALCQVELAPRVREKVEVLLRAGVDPRGGDDAIWRACCTAHGTVAPLVAWLEGKLTGASPVPRVRRLLARVHRRAGAPEAALGVLDEIGPNERTLADEIARAELLDALGRDSEALAIYSALAKRELAPDLRKKILLRRALMGRGLTALAAFAKDEGNTRAQRNEAAIVLAIMGDQRTAVRSFTVSGEGTERFRQQIRVAEWAIESGDFDAAQRAARDAATHAKLARDRRYALSVLASAYRRDSAVSELLASFEETADLDPDSRRLWVRLLREEGRADDALRLFHTATEGTFDAATRRQLLEICRETGRETVLVEAFERLIREEPRNLEWRSGLSRHFLEKGERARAIAVWDELGSARQDPKELMRAAYSLQAIGLDRVAEKLARRAAATPGAARADALLFVFRLHLGAGNQDAALAVLRELGSGTPPSGVRAGVADGYERLGRADLAVATLEELRGELGGFLGTDLEMKLAILLSRVGREDDALRIWRALWSKMRTTPRGRFVEDRMMTVAARTGALAKIAIELEDRLEGGKATTEDVELLVRLYIKVGDPASATEIIEVFLEQTGAESTEVLRRKAKIFLACQDYHHYEQVIHELVRKDPENRLDHLRELAMSQLERGRRDLTVALLPEIRAASGEDEQMADEFEAGVFGLCGMKTKALEAYVRGMGRHPERIDTYLLISNLMRETGREMQAARMFQYLAQTAERDDLFTIAIDGILNLRAARNTQVPTTVVRWALRTTLERLATRPHRFYLYRLVTDLAAELNDMRLAIRTLKSALPVAGERRTPVMRELMGKARMTDPAARRSFGQTRFTPSKAWDATDYIMVGRRLLGQGDHVPPQTFMSLASVFLRSGDVAAAMRTFNRAAEVLDYAEVLREAARVLEDSGRAGPALRYYRRLLATGTDDVGLLLKIGMLEEQLGRRAAAFEFYDRGVREVLGRKPRYVSHTERRAKQPTLLYRAGNVSAEDAALPKFIQGVLLTASAGELAAFLSTLEEGMRKDLATVPEAPGRDGDRHRLANYARLAAGVRVWRTVALGSGALAAAARFDGELMRAFGADRDVSLAVVASRVQHGYEKAAHTLLEASPFREDPEVRLAAGVVDRGATTLSASAAASLLPSVLGGDTAALTALLERVDTGRMSEGDQAAVPQLLAACVLSGAAEAAERFARAGLRHMDLSAARPAIGGPFAMSSMLTMLDRLAPGAARRLLREKMAAVARSKPATLGSFLFQFAEIDGAVGGGTLTSQAARDLALSLAKGSERYNFYLTNLLAYIDGEERAQVVREVHNALPRSQRPQFLLACIDYMGDVAVDDSYVEWYGLALRDALESHGDSVLGGVRLPVGRFAGVRTVRGAKRSPALLARAIDVFDRFRPGPENTIARVSVLIEQERVEAAFGLAGESARKFLADPSQTGSFHRLMSALPAEHRERKVALVARLAAELPENVVVRDFRWSLLQADGASYVAELKRLVAARPDDVDLLSRLAAAEVRYGWTASALRRYRRLEKLQPKSPVFKSRADGLCKRLHLPVPGAKPRRAPGARSPGRSRQRSPGARTARSVRALPIARVVGNPAEAKIRAVLELHEKGDEAGARRAFRRLWRNFDPVNQYMKFPRNLTYFARGPSAGRRVRTVFGRLEKELPFIAEEARAALGILDVDEEGDPYGLWLPQIREEILDIVARHLIAKGDVRSRRDELVKSVLAGTASTPDVGLLLRLLDAGKGASPQLGAITSQLLGRSVISSPERLQRLARLCVRTGEKQRAGELYRLSVLVGDQPGAIERLRKDVENAFGAGAKRLLLHLVDDVGVKTPTTQVIAWANSAVRLWKELLPPAEAAERMTRMRARLRRMGRSSRYVGSKTPGGDIVAATLARTGRFEEALDEVASWLRVERTAPRVYYGGRVRIRPDAVLRAVVAKDGEWSDRAAWLRALAARLVQWQEEKALQQPERLLGTLAEELAAAGSADLALRCVTVLGKADSPLPSERLAHASALRSIGRNAAADAIEEQLLAEEALEVQRIAPLVTRLIARDGPEVGLAAGAKALAYTRVPALLALLAKTADEVGRKEDAARWRAMLPEVAERKPESEKRGGAKDKKAAPRRGRR